MKWEYVVEDLIVSHQTDREELKRQLDKLGEDGWEAVAVFGYRSDAEWRVAIPDNLEARAARERLWRRRDSGRRRTLDESSDTTWWPRLPSAACSANATLPAALSGHRRLPRRLGVDQGVVGIEAEMRQTGVRHFITQLVAALVVRGAAT